MPIKATALTFQPASGWKVGDTVQAIFTLTGVDTVHQISGTDELGDTVTETQTVHEPVTVTTDRTQAGKHGVFIVTSSVAGDQVGTDQATVAANPDGSYTLTVPMVLG